MCKILTNVKEDTNEQYEVYPPIAAWRAAGTRPPVVFLVQGSRVRKVRRSPSTALQVTMIVFVDMHPGPVYLQPDIQMRVVLVRVNTPPSNNFKPFFFIKVW